MEINFTNKSYTGENNIIIAIGDDLSLDKNLDQALNGLTGNMLKFENFKGHKEDFLSSTFTKNEKTHKIMLLGLGKISELKALSALKVGAKIYNILNSSKISSANVVLPEVAADIAANIAYGMLMRSYKFDKYKTSHHLEHKNKSILKSINIISENENAQKIYTKYAAINDGIVLAKNLASEPPNVIYPESFVERCMELKNLGVKIEVLGEKEMQELGMHSLLGVGIGSTKESKLLILQYNSGGSTQPLAFVGKGVTFDTGGISLKPANGMEDMKYDMSGAAAVIGLINALAARKAKINVVGIAGLVENMPDGNAQRPSDVVTSMSGQTIEVLNTDAEGRLVLADALWYCQNRFKPKFMINLATLTGAIVVTFGSVYAGLFSNNDELANKLLEVSHKSGERLWRLPLDEAYNKQISSDVADMQNITYEKGAGSITAAQFLQRFVNNLPWAHLDIAGVANSKKDLELSAKGATGFGVRLLNQLVEDYYEEK
jgi:leucyl aminopeptidase